MTTPQNWPIAVWAGLIGTPLLISGGQVLFKIVSERVTAFDVPSIRQLLFDPYFMASMLIYAIATLSWIFVLRSVPLGVAYSFTALGFLFVPILSMWLFGETLSLRYFLGALLIMIGLVVINA